MKKMVSTNLIAERLNNRAAKRVSEGGYYESRYKKAIKELIPMHIAKDIRSGS